MTYEDYKNKNKLNKKDILKKLLSKLYTIVIFTMFVIILSNTNESFKNFLIDDVLNHTMDFSKVNNALDNVTNVFKEDESKIVFNEEKEQEEYKDGYKYYTKINEEIKLKDSGIITFIGEKEGYGNTIIVQQSNGYYAWYGNINEEVKLYDYIESGESIGKSKNDYYYYVLLKEDKPIKNEN